ncbi:asparaginase [Desertibacillus haloalkaliphilus]|uniref:asparaginase n=1 Tax=Desertibacillus haloalkaliphilus TaxID=1328930 RepID=UPI001C27B327|nr:asparaginase [Desertibacillus haloalkaliphilus]MBU8907213.1 asparaginase [Desertibacillus haloalkaliphilus]
MKKILLLHTGGTIAMHEDEQTGTVGPSVSNPLYSTIESLSKIASVIVDDFLHLPSPHITPQHMLELSKRIERRIKTEYFEGVVITHGTDTLEETAYLLDLLLDTDVPVVVTGAMRSSNELGADGPYNLISSVRTAASDAAHGKGVLVVLNDEIHTAKNVTKTHTSNIATFQSPQYGPIGIVTRRDVDFHHVPSKRERYDVSTLTKNIVLIKCYAGMDPSLLDAILTTSMDGLVIEAFGQGNVPPGIVPGLEKLIKHHIPIVLVSRSFGGIVQDTYSYSGGGRHLKELGIIFTNGLNGQKARIKLMIALEVTSDRNKLQELFLT